MRSQSSVLWSIVMVLRAPDQEQWDRVHPSGYNTSNSVASTATHSKHNRSNTLTASVISDSRLTARLFRMARHKRRLAEPMDRIKQTNVARARNHQSMMTLLFR